MAIESSPIKTLAMGGIAVAAIILAIVVAVNTFSDPKVDSMKPSTEPISGSWTRKAGVQATEPPAGVAAEALIAKDIASFDASDAASGTVRLTLTDGNVIEAKVMNSQPGHLLLQIDAKGGKPIPLTIAQMGDGGPTIVTDHFSNVIFEQAP